MPPFVFDRERGEVKKRPQKAANTVVKMSVPRELLDQLLSGYLDDALSTDERARVEQLLETDPTVADELAQLRELRQSLQAVAHADSDIKLDAGFADRVLGAAVARAHAEGLGEDHPLIRLAEQPSTVRVETDSSSRRIAYVMVGLAASIGLAVIMLRPSTPDVPGVEVAQAPVAPVDQDGGSAGEISTDVIAAAPVASDDQGEPNVIQNAVASADPAGRETVVPDPVERDTLDPKMVDPTPSVESIAGASATPRSADGSQTIPVANAPRGGLFVFRVKQTAEGRESDAVSRAMELAELSAASEKKIDKDVANFASAAAEASDGNQSVLLIDASMKKIDSFYLHLIDDEDGIESVGLTISMQAPILEIVGAAAPEPTEVRHQGTTLELLSDDGVIDQMGQELMRLNFLPVNRELLKLPDTKGPDELTRILVLVE